MEHMASHLLHFRPDRRQAGRQGPFLDRCAPAFSGLYIVFSFVSSIHGPSAPTVRMGGGRRAWQHRTRIDTGGSGFGRPRHLGWGCKRAGVGTHNVSDGLGRGGEGRQRRGVCRACTPCHVRSWQRSFCWWWWGCWKWWKWCEWCEPIFAVQPWSPLSLGEQGITSTASGPRATWGDEETENEKEEEEDAEALCSSQMTHA